MFPTINAQRKLTGINDIAFYTLKKSYNKGDIIIVDYSSTGSNIDAIKRLIATGGDTVCYYNGNILLNGEALDESYLTDAYNQIVNNPEILEDSGYTSADDWKNQGYTKSKENFERWCGILLNPFLTESQKDAELQDTEFFKNYSSKYSGSVKYNSAINSYILTVPENFVYFLGDNRAKSSDASIFGPLESKYILAKVSFISSGTATIYSNFWKEIKFLFA